ncbi:trypsin-like [Acanthaster planci]|uniref:Trypsin-like n=1 Tax=Acanthaster planci TaxID=133434 RepID=A0A8B7YB71_ACAPL|nr:trypsin-like [Acanthaster planci]
MKFLIPLACLLAVLTPALGRLIVGGVESTDNSRPYQVALYSKSFFGGYSQFCGGTLVNQQWVVSAAHCVSSRTLYVGLGYHSKNSHGGSGQQLVTGTWYQHPSYNSGTLDNDIALIKLSTSANIGNGKIAAISIGSSQPGSGTNLLVSGWGTTSSGGSSSSVLREVVVQAESQSECETAYGSSSITSNMFCAAASGKDSCQGDSGGPIVSSYGSSPVSGSTPNPTLRGIVSWGYGCADSRYPGVYTNIANYCSWISSTTSGAVNC